MIGEVLTNRCINFSLVPPIMGEKRRTFFLVRTSFRETHDWTNVKNVNNDLLAHLQMTLMLSSSLPCPAAWGSAIAMVLGLHSSRPNAHTEDLRLFAKCKYKLGSPLCQAVPRLSARVARQAQQGVVTLPPCEVFHPLKKNPFRPQKH